MEAQFMDGIDADLASIIVGVFRVADAVPDLVQALHAAFGSSGYEDLDAETCRSLAQRALDRLPANFEVRTSMSFNPDIRLELAPSELLRELVLPESLQKSFDRTGTLRVADVAAAKDHELTGRDEVPSRYMELLRRLVPEKA